MADDFSPLAYTLAGQRRNPYDRRRAYAQQIMQSGIDYSPVQHPLQGVARLAQALVGGWMGREIDRDEEAATKKQQDAFATAMSEVDPQKRIAMIAAVDPALGARLSGALAVKQAELAQQQELRQRQGNDWAAGFGQGGPQTAMPPGGAPPSSATPAPLPSGTVAGGNPGFQNNVGNLRVSPAAWEGKGTPHNGFETFATPQQGVNAAFKNLEAYGRANPQMTVAQAIARWAPPNENDTQGYIKRLSESTGINPGMPLVEVLKDPAVAATLLDGITRIEKGGLPPGVTADTFMTATRGAPPQAVQPVQLAQGSADANGTPLPPQVQGAPPPPQAPGNMPAVTPPAIPDVPRPAPNPQTVARLRQMIATGQATPQQAEQHLQQEIDRDWNVARERAKMEFEQKTRDFDDTRKRQGDLQAKAPLELIQMRTKNYEENVRPKAEAAVTEINSIHQTRQLLDAGVITGTGADARLAAQKFAQTLGIPWGNDQVANTTALQSAVGQRVLAMVRNLGAGAGISNADREYAAKIAGGEISMTQESMRRILDIGERVARSTLKNHDAEVARLMKLPGVAGLGPDYFSVQIPSNYDEWVKTNPLVQPPPAPTPPPPGAPPPGPPDLSAAGGRRAMEASGDPRFAPLGRQSEPPMLTSPEQARNLPSGTIFRTPDGRLKRVP